MARTEQLAKMRAKRSEQAAKLRAKLHELLQQGLRPADIDPQEIRNELDLPSLSKTTIKHYFQRWQHGLETPVLSAGLAGLAGLRETKPKEAVMTQEERVEDQGRRAGPCSARAGGKGAAGESGQDAQ